MRINKRKKSFTDFCFTLEKIAKNKQKYSLEKENNIKIMNLSKIYC